MEKQNQIWKNRTKDEKIEQRQKIIETDRKIGTKTEEVLK